MKSEAVWLGQVGENAVWGCMEEIKNAARVGPLVGSLHLEADRFQRVDAVAFWNVHHDLGRQVSRALVNFNRDEVTGPLFPNGALHINVSAGALNQDKDNSVAARPNVCDLQSINLKCPGVCAPH